MNISQLLEKMIAFSDKNIHDIDHLIRIWTYAKIIGELEDLDTDTQFILEVAAITHDIACPLCREKYGNTNGKHQEQEGARMVRDFLADTGMDAGQIERVAWLVGRHHTFSNIEGPDYQILIEADYIANASENNYSEANIRNFLDRIAGTASGKRLIEEIFLGHTVPTTKSKGRKSAEKLQKHFDELERVRKEGEEKMNRSIDRMMKEDAKRSLR